MRYGVIAVLVAAVAMVSGCGTLGTAHNDVLVFGTTTKIAIDVSAPVQNGAIPEFTIGYKRNEGVWMPLKPNGPLPGAGQVDMPRVLAALDECTAGLKARSIPATEAAASCANFILPAGKYVSFASGIDSARGGASAELDTYSVFASFGGRGSLGFSGAGGSMAQFFATGIAAQRLGANPAVAAALNADGDTAASAQADADKEKAKTEGERIRSARAVALGQLGAATHADAIGALNLEWVTCPNPAGGDDAKYAAIAKAAAESEKAAGGGHAFVGFERLKTKKDVMEVLDVLSLTEVALYRDARKRICAS